MPLLHPGRLFPADASIRAIALTLYDRVADLPIVSPHGHTDPAWFAENGRFADPASLLLTPDHYVLRMLRSQGVSYDDLGVPRKDGSVTAPPPGPLGECCAPIGVCSRAPLPLFGFSTAWRRFSTFMSGWASTMPTALFDKVEERLNSPDLRPRRVLDRCNVETIATTEFALDSLTNHGRLQQLGLGARIRTTYRPDDVCDPEVPDFANNLARFGEITGKDPTVWAGMLDAHRVRRAQFRAMGATATDHGTPTALTVDLAVTEKQALLDRALAAKLDPKGAELFRAQMLTEMAGLSVEDGMVMQLHAGVRRNTDPVLLSQRGPNLGADVPVRCDFVGGLQALLSRYGNSPDFRLIVFTLDETAYARELAPMAGYWPAIRLGPPWWFHDSPKGMRRYLDAMHESAGYYNLAGFNDDTRALLSIPARHDVWRREVCGHLAQMVAEHRLSLSSASELGEWLCYNAAKEAYRLP